MAGARERQPAESHTESEHGFSKGKKREKMKGREKEEENDRKEEFVSCSCQVTARMAWLRSPLLPLWFLHLA